jgi:hypothetical protein
MGRGAVLAFLERSDDDDNDNDDDVDLTPPGGLALHAEGPGRRRN